MSLTSDTRLLDITGFRFDIFPASKPVKDAGHVGRELDSCAYEAEVGGRLIDGNVCEAFLCQCERCRETAHSCGHVLLMLSRR